MAIQYTVKMFFRKVSKELLKSYFDGRGGLPDCDWNSVTEDNVEPVFSAWLELDLNARTAMDCDFRRVAAIATDEGTNTIIDEGRYHGLDLIPEVTARKNHYHFALWVLLEHPVVFDVASKTDRADHLNQRYWRTRPDMPAKDPDVSAEACEQLAKAVSDFFVKRDGRGEMCKVDPILRDKKFHYFFAYPSNYGDTFMGYENGVFKNYPQQPAFEVIFVYAKEDRTLELFAVGDKKLVAEFQRLFSQCILKEDIPLEAPASTPYALNKLKARGFPFPTEPADGIMDVRLKALRLALIDPSRPEKRSKRRITLEAEARVLVQQSRAVKAEKQEIRALLTSIEPLVARDDLAVSKWPRLESECLRANGVEPGGREQAVVFTEYADTADWLVRRFRNAGFTAERYSGRDAALDRDVARARFERREFQILVSTDAGNEGIDLQTAHVLVNWDIPWSLVRLEQRMGRIHRIGQERDVALYNLVATETREGEALKVLLDNFVVAASQLDGKLFDSLSLVAERMELDIEKLLSKTFEDDSAKAEAIALARAATAKRIEEAARQAAAEQASLRSNVDVAWAIEALQRDSLERINPKIVEAFLLRQAAASVLDAAPHAAGAGLFMLSRCDGAPLPAEFGGKVRSLVATSGMAIQEATHAGADVRTAIRLGPGEAPFRSLVDATGRALGSSLLRGGALTDPTLVTNYDLFCFEVELKESGGRRTAWWPCLIKVDETGAARCRWESLANLEARGAAGCGVHPAHRSDAEELIQRIAIEEQGRRSSTMEDWLRTAERELDRLPATLASHITDPDRRRAERKRVEQAVQNRLSDLRDMARVELGSVRAVGWTHVQAAGVPLDPTEADSEDIAMRFVAKLLRGDAWAVSDVHKEGRGYDLYAVRGRTQRCIEVKGVWDSAASAGVRVTGHELLIARQLAADYALYVVDHCRQGGQLFGIYPDPVRVFGELMQDVALVRIPGSALKAVRQEPSGD